MKLAMHHSNDSALAPLAGHLEGLTTFGLPGRAEFNFYGIANARRSALRSHGTRQGDTLVWNHQDRHHGEVTGRHEGRF